MSGSARCEAVSAGEFEKRRLRLLWKRRTSVKPASRSSCFRRRGL